MYTDERFNWSVDGLTLSFVASNHLRDLNISVLGELVVITEEELLYKYNFPTTIIKDIKSALKQNGLSLGMRVEYKNEPPANTLA